MGAVDQLPDVSELTDAPPEQKLPDISELSDAPPQAKNIPPVTESQVNMTGLGDAFTSGKYINKDSQQLLNAKTQQPQAQAENIGVPAMPDGGVSAPDQESVPTTFITPTRLLDMMKNGEKVPLPKEEQTAMERIGEDVATVGHAAMGDEQALKELNDNWYSKPIAAQIGAVHGIGSGFKKMGEAGQELGIGGVPVNLSGRNPLESGIHLISGATEMAFGTLMTVTPAGQMINIATAPLPDEAKKVMFSPITKAYEMIKGGKRPDQIFSDTSDESPKSEWGQEGLGILDATAAVLAGGHVDKAVRDAAKKILKRTAKEGDYKTILDNQNNITGGDVKKASDLVEQLKDVPQSKQNEIISLSADHEEAMQKAEKAPDALKKAFEDKAKNIQQQISDAVNPELAKPKSVDVPNTPKMAKVEEAPIQKEKPTAHPEAVKEGETAKSTTDGKEEVNAQTKGQEEVLKEAGGKAEESIAQPPVTSKEITPEKVDVEGLKQLLELDPDNQKLKDEIAKAELPPQQPIVADKGVSATKEAGSVGVGGDVGKYSEPKRYNSEIEVGQKYYDNRYGDSYVIEKMTPVEGGDVDVTLKYDKGKTRTESGNFLLYHIDAKQHSLSKEQPIVAETPKQEKTNDYYIYDFDNKEFVKTENAKPVKLDTEGDFFAVKGDNGYYTIYEGTSGQGIGQSGKLLRDAIKNANESIERNSKAGFPLEMAISEGIKRNGQSPRVKQSLKEAPKADKAGSENKGDVAKKDETVLETPEKEALLNKIAQETGTTREHIDAIRGVGKQFAEIQSRGAKVDNYQRQLEKYEKNPTEETKKKILDLEKKLGYEQSYFDIVDAVNKPEKIEPKIEKVETKPKSKATPIGKAIEPKPKVKTDVETVAKELNLSEVDKLIYENLKDVSDDNLSTELGKLRDSQNKVVEGFDDKILTVDDKKTDIDRSIDAINDADNISEYKKKKEVSKLNKEYSALEEQEKGLEEEKKKANDLLEELEARLSDVEDGEIADTRTLIDRVNNRLETRKAVKAGTDLFPNEANIPESEIKATASRIRAKKIGKGGTNSFIDFGISKALHDGALEFCAKQVEKGTKLGEAIAKTIRWVDVQLKGAKWNKGDFANRLNDTNQRSSYFNGSINIHTNISKLVNHKEYRLAKSGDEYAAVKLVDDLIKDDKLSQLKNNKDAIIVPVRAEESLGTNAIPVAMAEKMSDITGNSVDNNIIQINKTKHTGGKRLDRLFNKPAFDGGVQKGKKYYLVDDVSTSGSTLNELKEYIETRGGIVIGTSTLGIGRGGGRIGIRNFVAKELIAKFGENNLNHFLKKYGIAESIYGLTDSQARIIQSFDSFDSIRATRFKETLSKAERELQDPVSKKEATTQELELSKHSVKDNVIAKGEELKQWAKDIGITPKNLPPGTQAMGFGFDDLVDLAVKLINKGIDAHGDVKKAIDEAMEKVRGLKLYKDIVGDKGGEFEQKLRESAGEKGEQKKEKVVADKSEGEGVKALAGRVHEGEVPKEISDAVEKHGLNYSIESHPDAAKKAADFIAEVGIEKALKAARKGQIDGGAETFVWTAAIDAVHNEYLTETNPAKKAKLIEKETELIDEFDKKMRSQGRSISALQAAYQVADLGYKLGAILNRAKEAAGENGVSEILKNKLIDLSARLDEVSKKLAESEKKLKESPAPKIIKEPSQPRQNKPSLSAEESARKKELSQKYRGVFNDVTRIVTTIAEKDFREYAGLVFKEAAGDFKTFAREMINTVGKEIREHLPQLYKDLGGKENPEMQAIQKKLKNEIDEFERRKREKDFTKKEPKDKPDLDEETFNLLVEKNKLKEEIDTEIEKERLKNRPIGQKISDGFVDAVSLPKSLMASADMSAPLRQGAVLSFRHPIMAARAAREMFKQAFSEKAHNQWLTRLKSTPEYYAIKKAELYLAEPNARLNAKEEQFISTIAHRIPIWGHIVKGSERAYTGYLNKLRVDVFTSFHDALLREGMKGKELDAELKSYASFVNNASGRGSLGKFEESAPLLNAAFFSPRYVVSRFNLLNPLTYAKMTPNARMEAMKTMGAYLGVAGMTLAIAKAGGADVEDDPRSSDFGKIRVGNTRFDIWAGMSQMAVLLARLATGKTKSNAGDVKVLGEGYKPTTRADVFARFGRSKLSPSAGIATDFLVGKDFNGNDVTVSNEVMKSIIPLWSSDIVRIANDANAGVGQATAAGIASFFGVGVQNYNPKKKSTTTYVK